MIVTVIRTAVVYFFVTLAIRLMGKRQIGDMQPNELVVTLLISEIAAIPLQDSTQPVLNGVVAIFMLVIIEIIISVLAMKFLAVRKIMSGNSVVVINDGIIDQKMMKKVRLTVIDLIELLREQGYFKIEEIAFAILEVNGDLSVIEKAQYRPLKTGDIENLEPESATLPIPVISDGVIINESLINLNISPEKLKKIIFPALPQDIFLMTLDAAGTKEIIFKEK
ncbi:MAG: DUF421 domain-containing protein [Ruminococcaceae bacterium]|nr:DUF421 domain-containing protein [Oscillospiraceae bacterium]